ncbi:MAG: hypothetical protein K0R27_4175 [Xanthobacteraceae bacterium]|jgi:peptidoglycan/LPS O-acetylase OafA/YrhL|nr:hypothetical protein [Xanthobacteraceae bacterium]
MFGIPATRLALLQNLQVLRVIVAVQVVYGHALHEAVEHLHMPAPVDPFSQMNRIDIFFVISGFATFYAARGQFGVAGEGARFLAAACCAWCRSTGCSPA